MLLKLNKNLLLTIVLFCLGYTHVLHAGGCGVLRYMANKSSGVAITGNTCAISDDIALGSAFNLMPGARLWFKTPMESDEKTQGICQSRSSMPIRLSVYSAKQPWIKSEGMVVCSAWANNKMDCADHKNGQTALSCVIAAGEAEPRPKGQEDRTTSVRMRSLPALDGTGNNESSRDGKAMDKEQIISALQADIGLCKAVNPAGAAVKMTWLVETNGTVQTVIPANDKNDAGKPLIACLTAVIKDFAYPQAAKATWFSHQF